MKTLSRDFSTKEKVLLLILCLILLAFAYYRFVYVPSQDAITAAKSERDTLQTELMAVLTKEKQLKSMQDELTEMGEQMQASRMESYNNSAAELEMLNEILERANDYSISFSGVTRNGDQIRRDFTLNFVVDDFAAAKRIIERLSASEYRCLLGDMQYALQMKRLGFDETAANVRVIDETRYAVTVNITTTATFFETMYGGTPDAGLPEDKNAA